MKKIGIIGYGLRASFMMNAFKDIEADVSVSAVADPRSDERRTAVSGDTRFADSRWYESAVELLDREKPDGILLGTRCSLHTPMAAMVMERGIPLFLEKPVCISREQYEQLLKARSSASAPVMVSFPLRYTTIVREMKRLVENGTLGRITMVQATNNVPYGSVYYNSWYRNPAETGGLFLQKATHDIDIIHHLTGIRPTEVFSRTAKLVYRGDKPAGLRCPDCEEYRTCPESSYVVKNVLRQEPTGDACCFAVDTGNEDSASAIFTGPDGVLLSYNQCFTVKRSAGRRGCRLIGTRAAAEFDFYTGDIRVDHYEWEQTETHHVTYPAGVHYGADMQLALDFLGVMEGKSPLSTLDDGMVSAAACLSAAESAESRSPVAIDYGF